MRKRSGNINLMKMHIKIVSSLRLTIEDIIVSIFYLAYPNAAFKTKFVFQVSAKIQISRHYIFLKMPAKRILRVRRMLLPNLVLFAQLSKLYTLFVNNLRPHYYDLPNTNPLLKAANSLRKAQIQV